MLLENYKEEIELIYAQNRVECDLYSLIAQIFRESQGEQKVSLRDVSARRTTEFSKVFIGKAGFPDFVIRERKKDNNAECLGAIEVKYINQNLDKEKHQEQLKLHINSYKKVLYTNGLEWRFHDTGHNNDWKIQLGTFENDNIQWIDNLEPYWNQLQDNLKLIQWINE